MDNFFDSIQETAFSIVSATMGYTASWVPSNNSPSQFARVLFKDATETAKLMQREYDPKRPMIEYKQGDFIGLKGSVDAHNDEILLINNIQYGVNEITSKYDGKTLIASLQQL